MVIVGVGASLSAACGAPAPPTSTATASAAPVPAVVQPSGRTVPVPHDPDDPAIWRHPTDPGRSLILGTDKMEREGGLYVFNLAGSLRQTIAPLDRPNNVDIEYGFDAGPARGLVDIAVLTERKQHRLRGFAIPAAGGQLVDLAPAGLPVLEGATGQAHEPMGIALYKRPRDGAVFAIVAPKAGPGRDYLWQYRLVMHGGALAAQFVRRFGAFADMKRDGEMGEIEAVVADDALGFVYYGDEWNAIRKYRADPDAPDAARELAAFGLADDVGDREGLAIYDAGEGRGYVVSSDQIAGGTRLHLYRREGSAADPHDHTEVRTLVTASDETDGLDVSAAPAPGFPQGLLVMMNSSAELPALRLGGNCIGAAGGAMTLRKGTA